MNPILQKNKNVVVILAVVAVSAVVAKLAYDLNMNKVAQIKENIRVEQEKGEALERIIKTTETVKGLKERGWAAVDFASVADKVSDLAQRCNVKIQDLAPGQRKEETHIVSLPFNLKAEGTYKELVKFLSSMETEQELLRLRSVSLSPANRSGGPSEPSTEGVVLSIFISGEAYHFK